MITCRTPFRMSFIGGGSDIPNFYKYATGKVISCSINKFVYIFAQKNSDGRVRASYSKIENVGSAKEIMHPLIRECLIETGHEKSIEISCLADVPKGTGLGSSSAFTVSLLHALRTFNNENICKRSLAETACSIEIEKCKSPIGKQDQYASAFGGLNEYTFNENGYVDVSPIKIDPVFFNEISKHLIVLFTGKLRSSASVLLEQSRQLDKKNKAFELVKQMTSLTEPFKNSLLNQDLETMGSILNEGWKMKKGLVKNISNPHIDQYYNVAMEEGAFGGKLLGAGNGGYLMFLASQKTQEKIKSRLTELPELSVELHPSGSEIVFNSDTYR